MSINYANSWVEVCNRALGRLGKGRIDDLVSGGDLTQYCNLYLGEAIESVLQSHHWVGARQRVEIARSSTDPITEFAFAYVLPSDLITLVTVDAGGMIYSPEGQYILTDAEQVFIAYIPQPSSPASLPGYLKTVIASHLATLLAIPLASSDALRNMLEQEHQKVYAEAVRADGRRAYTTEPETWFDEAR